VERDDVRASDLGFSSFRIATHKPAFDSRISGIVCGPAARLPPAGHHAALGAKAPSFAAQLQLECQRPELAPRSPGPDVGPSPSRVLIIILKFI